MEGLNLEIGRILDAVGYPAAGAGVLADSAGVPFPGDALLVAVAAYAAAGHLDIRIVVVIGAAAALAGANLGYAAGYLGGRPFVEWVGPRLHLRAADLASAELLFARHGAAALLMARFLLGTRVWAAMLAGMTHMPMWRFQLFSAGGVVLWALLVGAAGQLLGLNWWQLERFAHDLGAGGLAALAAVTVCALLLLRWRARTP